MATPQGKVFNMPGLGNGATEEVIVTDGNTGNNQGGQFVNYAFDPTTGQSIIPGNTGMTIPPRPVTTPQPVPQPQPSGLNLGFLSNPINIPFIGEQPLWLVLLVGAGVWFFVLPMLSEHKGRKR